LLTAVKLRALTLRDVIPSPSGGRVVAVTSAGDQVFVLRLGSLDVQPCLQQVEVYDAVSCSPSRVYEVHALGDSYAWGLAVCGHNKCLYVSAKDNRSVYRADLTGGNAVNLPVMKWYVASGPRGLSVNKEYNVVVACHGENKLQEYTTRGSLVREICLQAPTIDRPWQALQLSTGEYVVSQDRSPGVVSVVGVDGQVRRSYGQSQTSDVGQIKYLTCLAVAKTTTFSSLIRATTESCQWTGH